MASRTASDGAVGGLLIALSLGACGGLPNDGGRAVSTAMTAEQAALHRDKLGIAGKVKHVAGVHKKGERSSGRVLAAGAVMDKNGSSNGTVLSSSSVEQERCRAHCSIGVSIV